jgi:hypothetical protein
MTRSLGSVAGARSGCATRSLLRDFDLPLLEYEVDYLRNWTPVFAIHLSVERVESGCSRQGAEIPARAKEDGLPAVAQGNQRQAAFAKATAGHLRASLERKLAERVGFAPLPVVENKELKGLLLPTIR